jgi:hypothetical protein
MSAAETIKKKPGKQKDILHALQPRSPRRKKIIELKKQNPALSTSEIGKLVDCSHVNVIHVLRRYGLAKQEVNEYKDNRADILAGLQHRLIQSITTEDIKKAPLGSRVLAAAQLYDKERLEVGKTTSNIAQVIFQMPAPKPVPDHLKMIIEEKNSEDNNEGGVSG